MTTPPSRRQPGAVGQVDSPLSMMTWPLLLVLVTPNLLWDPSTWLPCPYNLYDDCQRCPYPGSEGLAKCGSVHQPGSGDSGPRCSVRLVPSPKAAVHAIHTVRHREDEVGQRPAVTLAGSRSCLSEVNTPNDPLPGMRHD